MSTKQYKMPLISSFISCVKKKKKIHSYIRKFKDTKLKYLWIKGKIKINIF